MTEDLSVKNCCNSSGTYIVLQRYREPKITVTYGQSYIGSMSPVTVYLALYITRPRSTIE